MGQLLLAGIVLLGSSVQWLTGMGFALVAAPALVLALGPTAIFHAWSGRPCWR